MVIGHTLPGSEQQMECCSGTCWAMPCLMSSSVTWKRQEAALSSSAQMTLNQEEQMVYSKTGPLEQKLKEWADQHIIL